MDREAGPAKKVDHDALETARVGYQVAVDLWTYQGTLNWNRFSVMLAANSIILSVIGIVLSGKLALPGLEVGLCIVGLILCVAWMFLMARGSDYHHYWGRQARDLEERYLGGVVTTVSDGWAGFMLTMQSLRGLRDEGVPDEVLEDLKPLMEQRFVGKRKFSKALRKQIGKEQSGKYEELILKWAPSGKMKFSRVSRLGGSQELAVYSIIIVFAVVYGAIAVFRLR